MSSYCVATYRCHDDKADFHKKAQSIAVGLTVGSWTELPSAKQKQMEKHLGQVLSVEVTEPTGSAVDLANGTAERYADIRIAYPDINFSADIPALLVTVFGKLSMDGKVKLIDLQFSPSFLDGFGGPKFGIAGVRELLGVHDRPLLMSIFKSVVGHDLEELSHQFYGQAAGGVDLIKDDEILFENPLTPIEKRVEACMEAAGRAQAVTGQKLLYAVNVTGPASKLADQAKRAIDAGANALLFNVLAYGFDTLRELSADPDINVPIAAHPALSGALYPSPHYGISASVLLGKLMRLSGADLVLFPSPYGSVVMPKAENMAIRHALVTNNLQQDYVYRAPEQSGTDTYPILRGSFPVPSAGIHPGLVPWIIRDFGTEVVVNAGGGIHGHPLGTAAGGQAFRQAIDAVMNGVSLAEYAESHPELGAAIERWGAKE
ncbi:2,3-diketo-5-methylthiopentyl-1-phosphate enolase [Paenibacillus hemerocallicola]|uniref:2,3-diketo-5-methylthiopentyl-1-phosphate enolase n=1 Tax=Paenibacillus hemerocallicola TaxID=1172614 RepID=A0A5C4T3T5_9BACL|nr:2,3-diketo-5-methylthiopentyl-1-phosphate enolase [Paenibacillus hemerocallicola]TNJ63546.1 2,3-diketo-5-methylthiopentyl-1-phosphate enolase [Paenibacillus hemerocallicola]